jgi:hypothetical protein
VTPAALGSYVTAAGLLGLALYHASSGDFAGAATAVLAAFGLGAAANSGPAAPPTAN